MLSKTRESIIKATALNVLLIHSLKKVQVFTVYKKIVSLMRKFSQVVNVIDVTTSKKLSHHLLVQEFNVVPGNS